MNQILWRKKSLRTKLSVLLVFVLIGTMLSGCSMPGMLRAEAAETAGTTSGAEIESLGETDEAKDAAKDSGGESKSGAGEDALLLEYNSGGETPTITTVTFFPDKGMVEVNALASSMYELTYKSAYTMDDGKLAIDTVSDLTATDTSGVAKVIGLPETMTASAFHTVTDEDGASMLTIRFGDPEKSEEAAILCEIKLSEETLSILNEAAANVRELLFLEYASETEDEDSSQTTADIRFFSNGTCTLSGCLNSLYNWEYTTQWEFDNILIIEDPEVLNLIAVEDAERLCGTYGPGAGI